MKAILVTLFALLIVTTAFSQKRVRADRKIRNGYGSIGFLAGVTSDTKGTGVSTTFGIKPSSKMGVGLGFDLMKFKGLTTFYVPVYADLRYLMSSSKKVEGFFTLQPGYGLFSRRIEVDTTRTIEQKGGFYLSAGGGVRFKAALSPFIALRYAINSFKVTGGSSSSAKGLELTIGLAF